MNGQLVSGYHRLQNPCLKSVLKNDLTLLLHRTTIFWRQTSLTSESGKLWPAGQIQSSTCLRIACEIKMIFMFLNGWGKKSRVSDDVWGCQRPHSIPGAQLRSTTHVPPVQWLPLHQHASAEKVREIIWPRSLTHFLSDPSEKRLVDPPLCSIKTPKKKMH